MDTLIDYMLRITPGLLVLSSIFLLLPRTQVLAKIFVLILGFVLMRDAMTPVGYWSFGITDTAVWLRFVDDPWLLFVLGTLSLLTCVVLLRLDTLRKLVRWGRTDSLQTYVVGIGCGLLVAAPFLLMSQSVPIDQRGGIVAMSLLPALLYMSIAGNFLEELIFRGLMQSYFENHMTTVRAAVISGLLFAAAHVFLASTVTNLGWPLLVFVAIEGLACAFVYRRFGLISASFTHGVAIFFLACGII